jgi:hypothetical protein
MFHLREKAERSFAQNQASLLLTAAAILVIFGMTMDICLSFRHQLQLAHLPT